MGLLDRITAKATPYAEDEYEEYEDSEYTDYADEDDQDYFEGETEISPLRSVTRAPEISRIVTVWVSSYQEVRDFATDFRNGLPVVLNLSEAGDAERARIVDFALGLCFGLEGVFSNISEDVFLLTPATVKIDSRGEDQSHNYS